MADIEYEYGPVPTIWRFSQSRAFIRGLMGRFGVGKSSGCVMEVVQWAARQAAVDGVRRSHFAIVRNTYRQLQDTSIKTWLDWLPDGQFGTCAGIESLRSCNCWASIGYRDATCGREASLTQCSIGPVASLAAVLHCRK
jgi:hypothetical protein